MGTGGRIWVDEWNEWAGSAAADSGHWTASRQADNLTACLTAHTPSQSWAVTARSHQSRTGQDRRQTRGGGQRPSGLGQSRISQGPARAECSGERGPTLGPSLLGTLRVWTLTWSSGRPPLSMWWFPLPQNGRPAGNKKKTEEQEELRERENQGQGQGQGARGS